MGKTVFDWYLCCVEKYYSDKYSMVSIVKIVIYFTTNNKYSLNPLWTNGTLKSQPKKNRIKLRISMEQFILPEKIILEEKTISYHGFNSVCWLLLFINTFLQFSDIWQFLFAVLINVVSQMTKYITLKVLKDFFILFTHNSASIVGTLKHVE